jgi:YD repeat-containing protein
MERVGLVARRYGIDILIVLGAVEAAVEVAARHDALHHPRTSSWFAAPAIALVILPLLARRRLPFATPTAVWLMAAAVSFVDGRLIVFPVSAFLAGMAASFLLGSLRDELQGRLGLAVVLSGSAIVVYNNPSHALGELILIPFLFGIVWVVGFVLRERAVRTEAAERRAVLAERERDAAARVAVAEERARIARELHDIVAHAVSVMVLQVGAVRHKLPEAQQAQRSALQDVEHAGRTALTDMRQLLDAMREYGEVVDLAPQPGLDALEALLEEVGRAGLPVQLRISGDRTRLPRGIEISAYRIVQEGLTNALKHAHASKAEVSLEYNAADLRIEVRDNGRGAVASDGRGHGLVGIRERVKLYGGDMTAGTASGGGFLLSTRLPLMRGQP